MSKVSITTEMFFAPKHEDPKDLYGQLTRHIIHSVIEETELAGRKRISHQQPSKRNRCHHHFGTKDNVQRFHCDGDVFAPKHEDHKGLHGQWSRQTIQSDIEET